MPAYDIPAINLIRIYLNKTYIYREATVFDNDFVTIQAGVGCSSAVGKYGGEQFLTLDNHCFSDDTIVHEFIHSFGFWHEQNRPDRDQFVEIRDRFIEFGQGNLLRGIDNKFVRS